MRYFLIVGRILGDDEDTRITYHCETVQQACREYRSDMYGMENLGDEEIERLEGNGEGVFINQAFVSDAPIEDVYPACPKDTVI